MMVKCVAQNADVSTQVCNLYYTKKKRNDTQLPLVISCKNILKAWPLREKQPH